MTNIAIVGADGRKWTENDPELVKCIIRHILTKYDDPILISGHCPLGGVDLWAEEVAKELEIPVVLFRPRRNAWRFYKERNVKIAEACDIIYDIEPPRSCHHCRGEGKIGDLICRFCGGDGAYSGGTWTLNYAKTLGKEVWKIIVSVRTYVEGLE